MKKDAVKLKMEKIQKKKKLLSYRLHQLTDKDLCSMEMAREAQTFVPLRKKDYFRPEETQDIPQAPMDLYNAEQQELARQQELVDRVGWEGVDPREVNLDLTRDLRRDLLDPDNAILLLGKYSEEFEPIYEKALQLREGLASIFDEVEKTLKSKEFNVEAQRIRHYVTEMYNAMDRTVIPIFKTHRGIIWAVQNEIKRVGPEFAWGSTPEKAEQIGAPYKELPSGDVRFLKMREFKRRWIDEAEREGKIYKNLNAAVAKAWQRYENVLRLKGNFLVRYAQQNDFITALGQLGQSIEELSQVAEILSEEDRQTQMTLESELEMPKAAKLISPDNFLKIAAEPLDDFIANAPVVYGEDEEEEEEEIPPAQAIPDDGTLDPIPVDDDEFLRLKFPESDRMPESMWAKIQFAGAKNLLISITYTKITPPEEGMTKSYVVEPYSFRLKRPRRTGGGSQYYFFGYDTRDHHIKGFIYRRIQSIEILPESFDPRWEVEFHWAD